jgi:predicted RNase H-like HicB family nuclease
MFELQFEIEPDHETGGFSAHWTEPGVGGIATQGENLADLEAMVREAVELYFEGRALPSRVVLNFRESPILMFADEVAA